MKKKGKVVFKRYVQEQMMLLPPSYEELVPENHPVRVVNEVLERIDISGLERSYKGGDIELSSAALAEGCGVCIFEEHLFIAKDGAGIE